MYLYIGTIIESFCIVAPGSVVLPNTYISTHQFWAGNPAVYIRDVTDDEVEGFEKVS
jgi:carbonic anhydrase/acetyltransferase-like protein (isoleucine patch superfamily)